MLLQAIEQISWTDTRQTQAGYHELVDMGFSNQLFL